MTIDTTKIKPGDKITVEGVVSHYSQVSAGRICLSVGTREELYIDVDDPAIVSHTPKPVEIVVGTEFSYIPDKPDKFWTVRAIYKTKALCTLSGSDDINVFSTEEILRRRKQVIDKS